MVVYPWMRPRRLTNQRQYSIAFWVLMLILVTLMAGASIFARQNLRLGLGDRRERGGSSSGFLRYWAPRG
jgi:hypothetical protein